MRASLGSHRPPRITCQSLLIKGRTPLSMSASHARSESQRQRMRIGYFAACEDDRRRGGRPHARAKDFATHALLNLLPVTPPIHAVDVEPDDTGRNRMHCSHGNYPRAIFTDAGGRDGVASSSRLGTNVYPDRRYASDRRWPYCRHWKIIGC